MSTKMKISLSEFIEQINNGSFDKEAHLNERYEKSIQSNRRSRLN